jgi:hypothetical protein
MYAQWALRHKLSLSFLALTHEANRVSVLDCPPSVLALQHFHGFLLQYQNRHKESLAPEEFGLYSEIIKTLDGANQFSFIREADNLRRRLAAVVDEVRDQLESGHLPKEILTSLTLRPVSLARRSKGKMAVHTRDSLERLAIILSLFSIQTILGEASKRGLRQMLETEIERLEGFFYSGADLWEEVERREAVARLLWSHAVRDNGRLVQEPALLDSWWLLLQDFEKLEGVNSNHDIEAIEHEANSLSNILRFAQKLEIAVRIAKRRWNAQNLTTQTSQELVRHKELAEELKAYTRDLLLERSLSFCASLQNLAETGSFDAGGSIGLDMNALFLRVLLQYRGVYLAPGLRKLREISRTTQKLSSVGIETSHSPDSLPWRRYHQKCENVKKRLSDYRKACKDSRNREKVKPFVLLVVGQPGTGKSQFLEQVVKSGWMPSEEIVADLSQAHSLADQLEATWKRLYLSKKSEGICLLVLEEFDSQVGPRVEQYRQVLRPFWDAQSYVSDLGAISLGPYVAVCIMSKISSFAAARRMLASSDKGLDFLSRVDIVVEVPSFDKPTTQVELVFSALAHRFSGEPEVQISQLALWFLGWIDTGDNFRAITKALKTVSDRTLYLRFDDLNLDPGLRRDFDMLFIELSRIDETALNEFLHQKEEEFAFRFERKRGRIKLKSKRSLSKAFA